MTTDNIKLAEILTAALGHKTWYRQVPVVRPIRQHLFQPYLT